MGKYLISGYYGKGNVGDEAILTQIIRQINKIDYNSNIRVISGNPEAIKNDYNLNSINLKKPMKVLREINRVDYLLYGGGGHEFKYIKLPIYIFVTSLWARIFGKKVISYAIGIEPSNKLISKFLANIIYNYLINLIIVRDNQSKKALEEWGVRKTIHVTSDPVLNYISAENYSDHYHDYKKIIKKDESKKMVALSFNNKETHLGVPEFSRIVNYFLDLDWKVVLIPMCESEGDIEIVNQLSKIYQSENLLSIKHILAVDDINSLIGEFDLVIGMRFHLLIFSALNRIPFMSLANKVKINELTKNLKQVNLIELNIEQLEEEISHFITDKEKYKDFLLEGLSVLQKEEKTNQELLLSLM